MSNCFHNNVEIELTQDGFQMKLAKGDAIILDINKTKLQLLENQQF